jgi:phospholipase C
MIIVSPWTRGGWVNSQLFDHTSLIRFLEARFARTDTGLVESNITAWRRAVVGDLTSAFDFKTPNNARRSELPDTSDFRPDDLVRRPDEVPVPPADPRLPGQERGVRPARAIPYTLHADGRAAAGSFAINFQSAGGATGVFQVRSADPTHEPRSYTVEPGKQLTDSWTVASDLDLSVHGPNGFFRRFKGGAHGPQAHLDIRARYDERHNEIILMITSRGTTRTDLVVSSRYSSQHTRLPLKAGGQTTERWPLSRTRGWYDLVITVSGDPHFEYRYAGHLENGEDSISDPGMGGLV